MNSVVSSDSIIACSTGTSSNTAIGIIRISTSDSFKLFNPFFDKDISKFTPRKNHLCNIIDKSEIIDQIILSIYSGPNSYTGENVLELCVHGNQLNIERIINLFLTHKGLRIAKPGEFTYRALENKKLSLSQVEGLDLLLNAQSLPVLNSGQKALFGELDLAYQSILNNYKKLRACVDMCIDFLDDIGEDKAYKNLNDSFNDFKSSITKLHARCVRSDKDLLSPSISIIGRPNAGKSTLFNILLDYERSIVSSTPGTTRDYVSEDLRYKDVSFRLVDTAGIRTSDDLIESEGINKGIEKAKSSFLKVLIINPFDELLLESELFNEPIDIIIFTHYDHINFINQVKKFTKLAPTKAFFFFGLLSGPIEPGVKSGSIEPKFKFVGPIEPGVSSGSIEPDFEFGGPIEPGNKSGSIEPLLNLFHSNYLELLGDDPILLSRHRGLINKLYLELGVISVSYSDDIGIISSQVNSIGNLLEELIGIVPVENVLKHIFDNFCIGK